MKKTLLLLSGIFILAACSTNTYEIIGSVESVAGKQDGTAYIKKRVIREWITVDSAKIENGQFAFKGKTETPYAAYLVYTTADNRQEYADFIVEAGQIGLHINDSTIQRSGTEQNQKLQTFYDVYYPQDNIQKIVDFVLQNINTIVGNFVFIQTYYAMSIEEKEQIIKLMDEESLSYDRVPLIIKAMEVEKKTNVGQPFTDMLLPDMNGDTLALSSVVGKYDYVLVDFWASWCSPCRSSFPALTALYNKYLNSGKFEIYGVSLDSQKENWISLITNENLKWRHVSDLKGWECVGAQQYGINAIPSTVLINKKGIIVGRNMEIAEIESILTSMK